MSIDRKNINSHYDLIAKFEAETIMFPQFDYAYNRIKDLLDFYRKTGRQKSLVVLGDTGTGKSTLCKLIGEEYPLFTRDDRDIVPVLYISLPENPTPSAVVSTGLEILHDPAPFHGTTPARTYRLLTLMKQCGVEFILVDEIQQTLDRTRAPGLYKVGDWIKNLFDASGKPMVLLGATRSKLLLQTNEQLRRRFSATFILENMGIATDHEIEDFVGLVATLNDNLPVKCSLNIQSYEALERLHYATDGRISYLVKLFSGGLERALQGAMATIDVGILEQTFSEDIWDERIGVLNPFNPNFCFRRLDKAGEPFFSGLAGKKGAVKSRSKRGDA
ncbi:TniB family NTP-binding protein [Burkholderia sp. ABCPW 111]|uniref:TniB family NTP-binding protein n=1 Tax=Burkholderia sp. ABCPW 111 TaxID=1820025 RepID=UPI000530F4ED|nr:TniB family NTP-binding protein [Burkholderia sp. ABCPW 111]KGR99320.1 ATPase associated with various cellular activities family protein [Burkholderia sp. ABCPW 111]